MLDLTPRAKDLNSLDQRLHWFRRVRWAATIGHALVFFAGYFWLVPDLNPSPFLLVEILLIASNLALYRFEKFVRTALALGSVLVFDVMLLTGLLYSYGGHTNPFSMVYLVHVVLAAVLVGQGWTWFIAVLSSACFAALFGADGLGTMHAGHHTLGAGGFDLHLQGMLVAFVLLSFLIAGFVSRMRLAIDLQEKELIKRNANQDRLAALTQLSAGAAHELGTPLATINLIIDELIAQNFNGQSAEVEEDLRCIQSQLTRCSAILQKMAPSTGNLSGEMPRKFGISELVNTLKERFPSDIHSRLEIQYREIIEPIYLPFEAVCQTVSSLIKNALDASPPKAAIQIEIMQEGAQICFKIIDRGVGMDSALQARLGEPFFSTKEPGKGTGLGIFLCRLLVSRLDGVLQIDSKLGIGTTVRMSLPQQASWGIAV